METPVSCERDDPDTLTPAEPLQLQSPILEEVGLSNKSSCFASNPARGANLGVGTNSGGQSTGRVLQHIPVVQEAGLSSPLPPGSCPTPNNCGPEGQRNERSIVKCPTQPPVSCTPATPPPLRFFASSYPLLPETPMHWRHMDPGFRNLPFSGQTNANIVEEIY